MTDSKTNDVSRESPSRDWAQAPLGDLIDHLLVEFHRPLDTEMPRIAALAQRVLGEHGNDSPVDLSGIHSTFVSLQAELESHMQKEERILFPMIRSGRGGSAHGPVRVMQHEHDTAVAALHKLRALTNEFVAPQGACEIWRALWSALEAFEAEMYKHIRLENGILFPRALQG